jgi:hypothetical protein
MFEGIETAVVGNDRDIAELELGRGQRSIATAVIAGVATIKIFLMLEGGTGALVRSKNLTA